MINFTVPVLTSKSFTQSCEGRLKFPTDATFQTHRPSVAQMSTILKFH